MSRAWGLVGALNEWLGGGKIGGLEGYEKWNVCYSLTFMMIQCN
jgi:hypothetical protein